MDVLLNQVESRKTNLEHAVELVSPATGNKFDKVIYLNGVVSDTKYDILLQVIVSEHF